MTLNDRLRRCFYSHVITDPYPEITSAHRTNTFMAAARRCTLLRWINGPTYEPVPEVGPHKAWQDGFAFCKKLVDDELNRSHIQKEIVVNRDQLHGAIIASFPGLSWTETEKIFDRLERK